MSAPSVVDRSDWSYRSSMFGILVSFGSVCQAWAASKPAGSASAPGGRAVLAEESDLISFLANLEFAALPEDVVRDASLRLLDQAGIILAGTQELPARLAIDYAVRRRGSPESLILGTSERVDAEHAAFANGVSGHVLELDDGNRFAMGHPGVVVVPVVLALGEAIHATGQDAVAAIVAGYEMFVRLGSAMNPSHYNRGFHTTGTIGTLAATAAAARLLRF